MIGATSSADEQTLPIAQPLSRTAGCSVGSSGWHDPLDGLTGDFRQPFQATQLQAYPTVLLGAIYKAVR
ncbi:MAG: hypothetical protein ACRDTD_09725 [Pseudonocardiaceae bacterium]